MYKFFIEAASTCIVSNGCIYTISTSSVGNDWFACETDWLHDVHWLTLTVYRPFASTAALDLKESLEQGTSKIIQPPLCHGQMINERFRFYITSNDSERTSLCVPTTVTHYKRNELVCVCVSSVSHCLFTDDTETTNSYICLDNNFSEKPCMGRSSSCKDCPVW